jgi:hypothetical protein
MLISPYRFVDLESCPPRLLEGSSSYVSRLTERPSR